MILALLCRFNNKKYFHPLEVVGRGSDTQLQVGEKKIQKRFKLYNMAVKGLNPTLLYDCTEHHTLLNTTMSALIYKH